MYAYIIGALLSAAAIGLSHIIQGRRVVIIIFRFSLIDQWVVHITGALYYVMAGHLIYDLIAGFVVSARLKAISQ